MSGTKWLAVMLIYRSIVVRTEQCFSFHRRFLLAEKTTFHVHHLQVMPTGVIHRLVPKSAGMPKPPLYTYYIFLFLGKKATSLRMSQSTRRIATYNSYVIYILVIIAPFDVCTFCAFSSRDAPASMQQKSTLIRPPQKTKEGVWWIRLFYFL